MIPLTTEPSRETLVAQISALRALVERQRVYIGSMRASRFWRIREWLLAIAKRLGLGSDPLPVATAAERAISDAALGDKYQLFQLRHRPSDADIAWLRRVAPLLAIRSTIDVVLDARGAEIADCDATLASVLEQVYPYWRLVVWSDSVLPAQRAWLAGAAGRDARVVAEPWDGLTIRGEAMGAIDAGDLLEPDALLLVAVELHLGADLVYTDEDRLRCDGVFDEPQFKPDWSPESELTRDYVGRLSVLRSSVLAAAGGFVPATGTAWWYDVILRVAEETNRIAHVSRALYHRRESAGGRLAIDDVLAVLTSTFARRGERVRLQPRVGGVVSEFVVGDDERVAVIIPTRDRAELLDACLDSLFSRTVHPAFEAIVVNNGSVETLTQELLARWIEREPVRFRVIDDNGPFNFSRLNNRAVATVDAQFVVLLNNDTEVLSPNWMTAMLGQARRAPIGAVGALLLYEDGTVQHGGVMLGGVQGLAGHAHRNANPASPGAPPALRLDTNYLAVTGACLMVARAKFEQVGGLDESLAVAYNDVDLCLKLHAAGYRNVVVPDARLYHHESRSRGDDDTREKRARAFAESEIIRERWPALTRRDPYYNPNLTLQAEDYSVRL